MALGSGAMETHLAPDFSDASLWQLGAIALITSLAHGISGFCFPLASTPVMALLTDVWTAVIETAMRNITGKLISLLKGRIGGHALANTCRLPSMPCSAR